MSRRIMRSEEPLIAESRLDEVEAGLTTREQHFIRWHGPVPALDEATYRLELKDADGRTVHLTLEDVRALASRDVVAVLECAGNKRGLSGWKFPADSVLWGQGGVSCSRWTGAPVMAVLEAAGLDLRAAEVVFTGAGEPIARRSLPMSVARDPDTILAWAHDGEVLSREHGAPLRLVVPGWFGVAWIKAVVSVELVRDPYRGAWDVDLYAFKGATYPDSPRVTTQLINSVISRPTGGSRIEAGATSIQGFAWSPGAAIREVAVEIDGAESLVTRLGQPEGRGWTPWSAEWIATPGTHTISCRAVDETGAVQPQAGEVPPNDLGYGFNGAVPVTVAVERA